MDTQFANTFALISGVTGGGGGWGHKPSPPPAIEWRKNKERKKKTGGKQIEQKGKQNSFGRSFLNWHNMVIYNFYHSYTKKEGGLILISWFWI